MKKLIEYAKNVRLFFEREKETIELPFFYSFPKNSCEGASCILARLFMEKFPELCVEVIHGKNETDTENHFWVEVDGYVYDITGDQFDEITSPVYGQARHPMAHHFSSTKRYFASLFFIEYTKHAIDMEYANKAYNYIKMGL
ncbi:MAG: hypothetical protein WC733_05610 [Methylophilus sp.]|jgi:hypothetical protein